MLHVVERPEFRQYADNVRSFEGRMLAKVRRFDFGTGTAGFHAEINVQTSAL